MFREDDRYRATHIYLSLYYYMYIPCLFIIFFERPSRTRDPSKVFLCYQNIQKHKRSQRPYRRCFFSKKKSSRSLRAGIKPLDTTTYISIGTYLVLCWIFVTEIIRDTYRSCCDCCCCCRCGSFSSHCESEDFGAPLC